MALEVLEVRGNEAIALEDALNGILAAKGAGMFGVAVPHEHTRHMDFSQADLRLDSLAELPLAELVTRFS
jgi:putative hydrolase of the HAD superfamily